MVYWYGTVSAVSHEWFRWNGESFGFGQPVGGVCRCKNTHVEMSPCKNDFFKVIFYTIKYIGLNIFICTN